MTLDEFEAMPVIMDSFPLTFKTGRQKWTNFEVSCNECKRPVAHDRTRGTVERETLFGDPYRGGKSFTQYHVVAHALCPVCDKLTTATYVLHEDMTLTGVHPKTGEKARWGMRKLTLWEKFVSWYKDG
jgi:hypothetical protein